MSKLRRRRVWSALLLASLGLQSVSCGTILYPERKGQPAGRLDPKVVALDAVGLIFFFVPGVIAFAVDFNNGSIYLPSETLGQNGAASPEQLVQVRMDPQHMSPDRIEAVVADRTGRKVRLENARTQKLERLDQFAGTRVQLEKAAEAGE